MNAFQDKDFSTNVYNGNNDNQNMFFLHNTTDSINFNFKGTLKTSIPTTAENIPQQLILEGTTIMTKVSKGSITYGTSPTTSIAYSRCYNTLLASNFTSDFFNGNHNLSFFVTMNNYINTNPILKLRVVCVPTSLLD